MATSIATLLLLTGGCAEGSTAPTTSIRPSPSAAVTQSSSPLPTVTAFSASGPGRHPGETISAGERRQFLVYVPDRVAIPTPLVIVFHGLASPGEIEALSGMNEIADEMGWLVAYPDAIGHLSAWRTSAVEVDNDVTFTRELVDLIDREIGVDRTRIYAAGMSNGGGMAGRLRCEAADLIASVAVVAAAHPRIATCDPVRPVATIAFHGAADRVVPLRGLGPLAWAIEPWMAVRASENGCDPDPAADRPVADVRRLMWRGCDADVVLYIADQGRHGWPGSDRARSTGDSTMSVDASALMASFFAAHPIK